MKQSRRLWILHSTYFDLTDYATADFYENLVIRSFIFCF